MLLLLYLRLEGGGVVREEDIKTADLRGDGEGAVLRGWGVEGGCERGERGLVAAKGRAHVGEGGGGRWCAVCRSEIEGGYIFDQGTGVGTGRGGAGNSRGQK